MLDVLHFKEQLLLALSSNIGPMQCDASLRKQVTTQFNNLETTQNLFISDLIDICSVNHKILRCYFQPMLFLVLSYALSLTP